MRILVLGTSHAGALRGAFPAIRSAVPALELDFWGLPGGAFMKASVGSDGLLRPDPSDKVGMKKVEAWNGKTAVDLAAYDRIFLVGLRFGLAGMQKMMADLQPLEWGRRTGAMGVSQGFLQAGFEAEAMAGLMAQDMRTPLDARFTLMPAPYPAQLAAAADGPRAEPALRKAAGLDRAVDLLEMAEAAMAKAHADRGIGFVPQPRETLAAPFLTRDAFLEDPEKDARHMNSDYGLIALRALLAAIHIDISSPKTADAAKRA